MGSLTMSTQSRLLCTCQLSAERWMFHTALSKARPDSDSSLAENSAPVSRLLTSRTSQAGARQARRDREDQLQRASRRDPKALGRRSFGRQEPGQTQQATPSRGYGPKREGQRTDLSCNISFFPPLKMQ